MTLVSFDTLLAEASRAGLSRLEARVLLEHASGRARVWQVAHGDEAAGEATVDGFRELVRRRVAGEPLAYLVGEREFMGRRFAVDPRVLIPRPETELLARLAIEHAPARGSAVDLGTGSGVLALTLALACPALRVVGIDASDEALAVARENARRLEAPGVDWRQGDWWGGCRPGERFDLAVSNPPYVAAGDPHLGRGDLRFEPIRALAAGPDGLAAIRRLAADAPGRLAAGAWLLIEHGWSQGAAVREILAATGLAGAQTWRDDAGHERVTGARARGDEYPP